MRTKISIFLFRNTRALTMLPCCPSTQVFLRERLLNMEEIIPSKIQERGLEFLYKDIPKAVTNEKDESLNQCW